MHNADVVVADDCAQTATSIAILWLVAGAIAHASAVGKVNSGFPKKTRQIRVLERDCDSKTSNRALEFDRAAVGVDRADRPSAPEQQAGIAERVEPVIIADGMGVGRVHLFETCKR
jgi:hypothetical protein